MTKDEIKNRIAEIKKRLKEVDLLLKNRDLKSFIYKIVINSAYGAVSSRMNPMGNDNLANAITMMGSTSIQQVNTITTKIVQDRAIREHFEHMKAAKAVLDSETSTDEEKREAKQVCRNGKTEILQLKDFSYCTSKVCTFNDTDSMGLSVAIIPVKLFDKSEGMVRITDEGYKMVAEVCDEINKQFREWYSEVTNSHNCRLHFKREKICDIGIWLKKGGKSDEEARKNYVVRVIDNEGVKHFDGKYVKYTGVKLAKSVIPKPMKTAAKEIVWTMLDTQDRRKTDEKVKELYKVYCDMGVDDKAAIQRANGVEKKILHEDGMWYDKGTPGHIKAALNYNYMIKKLNLVRYTPIVSGDTYKIVHLKKGNKLGFEKMAYLEDWPKEFDEYMEIDNIIGFNKLIYEEIKRFYKTVNWPSVNPTDNYEMSLLDILGI